ncbi:MAG: 4'-phosphopantetheinyl transferase superfamily protein [Sphingobacteriales bacterium]
MLSTGNDIVSVNAINVTRTKQPNFYSKILTPTETALHGDERFATIPFEIFVWLLWSIKESAFKFLQRIDGDILFTPVKFEVSEIHVPIGFRLLNFDRAELTGTGFGGLNAIRSTVKLGDDILYSNSLIFKEFVVSVVNSTQDFTKTYWGIRRIDSNDSKFQSVEVRTFLVDNIPEKDVVINKDSQGIPVLTKDDEVSSTPISLSHHEYYVAYSFQLPV